MAAHMSQEPEPAADQLPAGVGVGATAVLSGARWAATSATAGGSGRPRALARAACASTPRRIQARLIWGLATRCPSCSISYTQKQGAVCESAQLGV